MCVTLIHEIHFDVHNQSLFAMHNRYELSENSKNISTFYDFALTLNPIMTSKHGCHAFVAFLFYNLRVSFYLTAFSCTVRTILRMLFVLFNDCTPKAIRVVLRGEKLWKMFLALSKYVKSSCYTLASCTYPNPPLKFRFFTSLT